MNMEAVIRVQLEEDVFNTFLYYINKEGIEEYVVKRSEALKDFTNFLSDGERKVIELERWINYVIFSVDKCTQ